MGQAFDQARAEVAGSFGSNPVQAGRNTDVGRSFTESSTHVDALKGEALQAMALRNRQAPTAAVPTTGMGLPHGCVVCEAAVEILPKLRKSATATVGERRAHPGARARGPLRMR